MKDILFQIRINEELNNKLEATVAELIEKKIQPKVNKSELARQAIEQWIEIHNQTQEGKTDCMLEIQDFHSKDLAELNDLLIQKAVKTKNKNIRKFLVTLEGKLHSEYPIVDKRTRESRKQLKQDLLGNQDW